MRVKATVCVTVFAVIVALFAASPAEAGQRWQFDLFNASSTTLGLYAGSDGVTVPSGGVVRISENWLENNLPTAAASHEIELRASGASEASENLISTKLQTATIPACSGGGSCWISQPFGVAPAQVAWTPTSSGAPVRLVATNQNQSAVGRLLDYAYAHFGKEALSFAAEDQSSWKFDRGQSQQAGPTVINCGTTDAQVEYTGTTQFAETTTLGVSVSVETGFQLEIANASINVTVSASEAWTNTRAVAYSIYKWIGPYSRGWLTTRPDTVTAYGDWKINGSVPIVISGIGYSEPGMIRGNDGFALSSENGYQWIAHQVPLTSTERQRYCGADSGVVTLAPSLGAE